MINISNLGWIIYICQTQFRSLCHLKLRKLKIIEVKILYLIITKLTKCLVKNILYENKNAPPEIILPNCVQYR